MLKRNYTHIKNLLPVIKEMMSAQDRQYIWLQTGLEVVEEQKQEKKSKNCAWRTECIYRRKPKTFKEAHDLIDKYIPFYNHKRIQNKTGVAPLTLRHSA